MALSSGGAALAEKGSVSQRSIKNGMPAHILSGRIVEGNGRGLAGVSVLLWDEEGDLSLSSRTDNEGEFSFEHKPCGPLTLEVLPPLKAGYASVLLESLPGKVSRKLIVKLRPGFVVSGRVEHQGKGLKGVIVRVSPGTKEGPDSAHGGGAATTAKDGSFSLILTAGQKKLTILNTRYQALTRSIEKEFVVHGEEQLGDFSL